MIGPIVRSVAAVLAGLVAAMVLIVGVEVVSSFLHPLPEGADHNDPEVMKAHVANYPTAGLLLGAVGWGLTVFVSAWLATRLGSKRHLAHGVLVGALLLTAALFNMAMLPYPIWFWIFNLIAFPAGAWYGAKLGQGLETT